MLTREAASGRDMPCAISTSVTGGRRLAAGSTALLVGDRRADPVDRRGVGPDQGGDEAGRIGVGRRWRAPAGAGPGSAPRGSWVSRSAKVSALASTWRESWFPATPRTSAARASPSAVGGQRGRAAPVHPGRAEPAAPPSSAREQQPERRDERHEGEPARDVVVLHVAELVGDDRAQLGAVRAPRAGCRRGPPASSSPIPST